MPTLALDIGGSQLRMALLDAHQRLTAVVSSRHTGRGQFTPEALVSRIQEYLQQQGFHTTQLDAIGISIAGLVDPQEGCVLIAENLGWSQVQLGPLLQQAFKTPVHLDTDVFCGALAEARLGGGHMCEATLYVAIGTGIGHAWILNGRVWRGTQGAANAIGHLVVEPEGARCYCGNRGCLCQYVSGPGLLALAARFGSLQPSVAAIVVAAREGNAAARLALRHANDYLAQGLAHAVNLMAPRRIVLAGGVIASGWPEPTALRRRLSTFCYPGADNAVAEIVCSSLGERSCLMGAALLTQKSLLQNGVSCDRPFFDR